MKVALLLAAAAALTARACPTENFKICEDYTIPVTTTSNNLAFGLSEFQNNFDVSDFVDTITSRDPSTASSVLAAERQNLTANYDISATFCKPAKPGKKNTVLIATHGLNFDRSYWDPDLDKVTYSFVDWVISQGYSIFYYDRLGVGKSSQVSGYVAQLANQVAIATELTRLVKSGLYVADSGRPDAVVLVGHSFGSLVTLTTAAESPELVEGVVLTGFSLNSTYQNHNGFVEAVGLRVAAEQDPEKWGHLDTGYLTPVDLYANVGSFFKAPDYSHEVAMYADSVKTPFAVTELLDDKNVPSPPYAFKGPAMIISGKYDFIFCTSDCDDVLENPGRKYFANASAFKAVSYPGAGHGLNLHLNAAGSFKEITDFLGDNGL
ncbi:Alpha/Beta hydrolase protein [Cercophora newfieldiana]|uniref:Alpha/Beta hydrolase protein n=1 Tax=Cercophora newfieldiana TaxID=92897 RepID=A0AA40CLZ8_9PEZI|nr:Alpha/Beta hydrolase protein [Cercophora newfieldiana]